MQLTLLNYCIFVLFSEKVFTKIPGLIWLFKCYLKEKEFYIVEPKATYMSHHPTSKHQCTRLGLILNLNSQRSSLINEG